MTTTTYISGDWELPSISDNLYAFAFEATAIEQPSTSYRRVRYYVTATIMEAIAARQILLQQESGFEHQQIIRDGNGFLLPGIMGNEDRWILPNADGLFDAHHTGIDFYSLDADNTVMYRIRNQEIKEL